MPGQSQTQSSSAANSLGKPVEGIPHLADYDTGGFFDELVDDQNRARPDAEELVSLFNRLPASELGRRQQTIERALYRMGITFTVYSDKSGTEKIMPFDVVPRIVSAMLWKHIEAGLKQRIKALNRFLCDIYNEQEIVREGIIPAEIIESCPAYLKQCVGLRPFNDVWCHITGTDLVRDNTGSVYVLEDNLALSFGRLLRAAKPTRDEAQLSSGVSRLAGASRVRLQFATLQIALRHCSTAHHEPNGRRSDPRCL